jgi:hypothetical protein
MSRHRLLTLVSSWHGAPRSIVLRDAAALVAMSQRLWRAGDLVVVFLERNEYIYVRFSGQRNGDMLQVYLKPDESATADVSMQQASNSCCVCLTRT